MRVIRIFIAGMLLATLTGWGNRDEELAWPHSGPMPDNPVKVKPLQYKSIGQGNQSYRPIEPMPWGDVNKRVMPKGSGAGSGSGSTAPVGTPTPQVQPGPPAAAKP